MYKPEINIDNKPLRVAIVGGMRGGKMTELMHMAMHVQEPTLIVIDGVRDLLKDKTIQPKPIELVKPSINYNRFRQGSNLTPKKKKRKK